MAPGGNIVYAGPRRASKAYFASLGYSCPLGKHSQSPLCPTDAQLRYKFTVTHQLFTLVPVSLRN